MTPYQEYERKSNKEFKEFKREQSEFRKEEKRKSKERIRKMKARIKGSEDSIKISELKERTYVVADQELEIIERTLSTRKFEKSNMEGKSILEYMHEPKR